MNQSPEAKPNLEFWGPREMKNNDGDYLKQKQGDFLNFIKTQP